MCVVCVVVMRGGEGMVRVGMNTYHLNSPGNRAGLACILGVLTAISLERISVLNCVEILLELYQIF